MAGTKPSDGEAAMACGALAAEAQERRQYRSAAILRRAAHVLRAFGPMLEALEAVETRLKECAHSLPGGKTPEQVVAIAGAVPIDTAILKRQLAALTAARKEATDGGAPSVKLGPQNFACRRTGCEYRFPESELASGWCPKCGGRVEPLPRTVHTYGEGHAP